MHPPFEIELSPDRLSATLRVTSVEGTTAPAVLAKFRDLKIVNVDEAAIAKCLANKNPSPAPFVVAAGTPPVDELPGKIDLQVPMADDENGVISKVIEKQVLATVAAPTSGTDGRNIFGEVVPFKKNANADLGNNTLISGGTISASAKGNVRLRDNRVTVEPLLELHADEPGTNRQLDFDGDVVAKGTMDDAWRVRITGSLIVNGVVEAAHLKTTGSIFVRGGIVGKDKGACTAQRHISCRYLSHAFLIAGGDVHVGGEISQSRVVCAGKLYAKGGPISGGRVMVGGGIECLSIGNLGGMATIVEAGADQILPVMNAAGLAEINNDRKRAETIREKIGPLMKHLKELTAAQRERVMELMYEAEELEERINAREAVLLKESQCMKEKASDEIVVVDSIHDGVTLRLSGMEAIIKGGIKGPCTIKSRPHNNGMDIVVVEHGTERTQILQATRIDQGKPSAAASDAKTAA